MPFTIPLTGLAANDPVPGNYLEINFAQGAASLGSSTYAIILIGNKTTAGDATVDTAIYGPNPTSPLPLVTTQDAITRFGQGSELHRMFIKTVAVNTTTPVYAIAVAESAGVAATAVVTFTTTATNNGSARFYMGAEFVDGAITSGDTVTTIAASVASAINTKADWAVTASSALGVLTVTAKNKGPRGNRLRASCVIQGNGVGTTSSLVSQVFFGTTAGGTDGTTADSNTNALATILPFRYYYQVSAADDLTQLSALKSQIETQAQPITGIRQRLVAASSDTSGAATTIATTLNSARAELVWMQNCDLTPSELASNNAAIYAVEEAPLAFRCNFSGYGNDANTSTKWKVPVARSGTAPTRSTIKAALNNGLTPIATNANGTTYLVKRITTRSLSGATNDYRIRDSHKVTVCDRFGDDLLNKFALEFAGKKLANDPKTGQRTPGSDVVTPRNIKASVLKLERDYADLDLIQNLEDIEANTLVIREASPVTRASVKIPLETIDILDQIATSLDQVA